jgi:DNA repair photolyase
MPRAKDVPIDLDIIEKSAKQFQDKDKFVLLSFLHDPFIPGLEDVLEILYRHEIKVNLLTKAARIQFTPAFELIVKNIETTKIGVSLTYEHMLSSHDYEPDTASPNERINNLKKAKQFGISTWVSLEPIITIYDALELIKRSSDFTDEYKIGILNHHKSNEDWSRLIEIKNLLDEKGKKYVFKKDCLKYLNGD